jgi:hypothetical protein
MSDRLRQLDIKVTTQTTVVTLPMEPQIDLFVFHNSPLFDSVTVAYARRHESPMKTRRSAIAPQSPHTNGGRSLTVFIVASSAKAFVHLIA